MGNNLLVEPDGNNDTGSRRVLVMRANGAVMASVSGAVRAALREAFPDGVPRIQTMAAVLEPKCRPWRLGATPRIEP